MRISQPVKIAVRFFSGKSISGRPPNPLAIQTNFSSMGYSHHLNPYWKLSPGLIEGIRDSFTNLLRRIPSGNVIAQANFHEVEENGKTSVLSYIIIDN